MKFKSDSTSVAELARISSTEDLTQTIRVLEGIGKHQLSNGEKIEHNIQVLRSAIKYKTEAAVYAFHKYDGLGEAMGEFHDHEGMSVLRRFGDRLQHILGCERPRSIETVIRVLKKQGVKKIYTGCINGEFCGIPSSIHNDENDSLDWDIEYSELRTEEIEALTKAGIEVIVLDELV